jgi:hypothetical protein
VRDCVTRYGTDHTESIMRIKFLLLDGIFWGYQMFWTFCWGENPRRPSAGCEVQDVLRVSGGGL